MVPTSSLLSPPHICVFHTKESQQLRYDLTSDVISLPKPSPLSNPLPDPRPLPSQLRKSELFYAEHRGCGLRGSPTLGHLVVRPPPERLQEGIKLRQVKVQCQPVFPKLPLSYQRKHSKEQVGGNSDSTTGFCYEQSSRCFPEDLMRWAKVRKPRRLQIIVWVGRDL